MPKMLDAALDYARNKGTPVFPCRTDDKSPLTPNGFKDATTDEKQIRIWWTQYPSAMIGMPTGKASGMWVLDLDVDPGKGLDGIKELEKLIAKNGPLPKTRSSKTPRGGMHLFFAYTGAIIIKNSTSKLAPGIDVRGEGGYVILPPSMTADGTSYSWCDNSNFAADSWIPNQLTNASPRTRAWAKNALEKECAAVAAAKPGSRNDALNTAAFNLFQIVAGGALDEDLVRSELYTAAVACGLVDDDGEKKVWATIESGASAGRQQPRYRQGNDTQSALVLTPTPPTPPPGGAPGGASTTSTPPPPSPPPPPPQPTSAPAPSPTPAPAPARPRIRLIEGELPRVVDEAEDALLVAKKHLYQRGGMVVRPTRQKLSAANNKTTVAWELVEVTAIHLRETLTRIARFEKMDYRIGDYVPKNCPKDIAETYLARRGEWKLPLLLGIVNCPFLRVDGTICERPGYDLNSALLFISDGQSFPAILQNPTFEQAKEALKYLNDTLLSEFPFVEKVDHSVALSAILSAFDRRSMMTAPLHAYTSPTAGTGKSLLVDLVCILLTGQLAPVISQGKSEEEFEKRLDAALLCSDQIISVDNCDRELTSNRLCQALTQQTVKVRRLGYSENVSVPVTSIFFATGNNLIVGDDLTRRTLLCRLDAGMAQPELREFKSNVLEQARAQRGKLVRAVLTILRAWHAPGTTVGIKPALGSFEDWSFRVRSPLMWLDQVDPALSMETIRANDPARLALSAIQMQWKEKLGTKASYTPQQIINRAVKEADFFGALMVVAAARNGNGISNDRLGRYLAKNNGKIIEHPGKLKLKLDKQSMSSMGQLWKLTEK